MEFVSTRNKENRVGFTGAIRSCHCADGGLYVPASEDNLRPWVYYLKDTTSFSSIAGSLTTAIMKDEFSPLVCEAIATAAFPFSPDFVQLEENLFKLSLFTGPTGSHKDFGVSYLVNCLEYTLLMEEKEAIVFAISDGEIGASLAHAMKGKKHLKALILFPRGTMRGFRQEDCVWNGGNIYPVEVDGSRADCSCLAQRLFARRDLVERYRLTLANTVNIGRLLPQTCFYLYAFSRLKEKVYGDIFYAVAPGNYGNLVAGLYGWQYSLPVNAFVYTIINDEPVAIGNVSYSGGSDGGDIFDIRYDKKSNRHVLITDGEKRDSSGAGKDYVIIHSLNGATLSNQTHISSNYLNADYDVSAEKAEKIKEATPLCTQKNDTLYYWIINNKYVSEEDCDSAFANLVAPTEGKYQYKVGTYSNPIKE